MTPHCVTLERRRLRRSGWDGRVVETRTKIRHGAHYVRSVVYLVKGELVPHLELWETHDRARRARIVPVASLVHLVQNIGHTEMASICKRRKPKTT